MQEPQDLQEYNAEQGEDNVDIIEEEAAQQAADRPRITTRYMTKYEKARVLGTRALQIRQVHPLRQLWLAQVRRECAE